MGERLQPALGVGGVGGVAGASGGLGLMAGLLIFSHFVFHGPPLLDGKGAKRDKVEPSRGPAGTQEEGERRRQGV